LALLQGAQSGDNDLIKSVIYTDININTRGFGGKTALGRALSGNHQPIAEFLIKWGAKTENGYTPLEYAVDQWRERSDTVFSLLLWNNYSPSEIAKARKKLPMLLITRLSPGSKASDCLKRHQEISAMLANFEQFKRTTTNEDYYFEMRVHDALKLFKFPHYS
jgi:ankyrin repeat protein